VTPDDHPFDERALDARVRLQHHMKSPLTIIAGRCQLLTREIRRSPSLEDAERAKLLAGLAAIDAAVHQVVQVVDRMNG
jgi:hypothetical protein